MKLAPRVGLDVDRGAMIKQFSTTLPHQKESKFTVGSFHQNRKGLYEIVAINNPHAKIRYQDGTEAVCNLSALRRIAANLAAG